MRTPGIRESLLTSCTYLLLTDFRLSINKAMTLYNTMLICITVTRSEQYAIGINMMVKTVIPMFLEN